MPSTSGAAFEGGRTPQPPQPQQRRKKPITVRRRMTRMRNRYKLLPQKTRKRTFHGIAYSVVALACLIGGRLSGTSNKLSEAEARGQGVLFTFSIVTDSAKIMNLMIELRQLLPRFQGEDAQKLRISSEQLMAKVNAQIYFLVNMDVSMKKLSESNAKNLPPELEPIKSFLISGNSNEATTQWESYIENLTTQIDILKVYATIFDSIDLRVLNTPEGSSFVNQVRQSQQENYSYEQEGALDRVKALSEKAKALGQKSS